MCRLAGSSQAVLSSAVREEESSCTAQHLPTAVSRLPTWQMPQMLLLLLFSNMLASCEMLLFFFSFLPSIIDMTSLHKHSHVLYLHIHWEFFEDQPIFIGPCFLLPLPKFFALFWSHLTTGNGSSSPLLCLPCPVAAIGRDYFLCVESANISMTHRKQFVSGCLEFHGNRSED